MTEPEMSHDQIHRERLRELAADLAKELGDAASVTFPDLGEGWFAVDVAPSRDGAIGVFLLDCGEGEIQVEVGDGGRWESASFDLAEDLARSAIAGRAREVHAPHRAAVDVTLHDGRVERSVVYDGAGCLPIPRWQRRDRWVQYDPYV